MNSIHDMGGLQGLGELDYQESEPMFHDPWEGRVHAMVMVLRLFRGFRTEIESIPAAEYLRMSYYERWLKMLSAQVVNHGLVTREEIESGRADPGAVKATSALTPDQALQRMFRRRQSDRETDIPARFQIGQRVRGRNINPIWHTRMPRYTRGRTGVVERHRGVSYLPDNETSQEARKQQHVYLIRFTARELWGEQASARDSLYIDMWEDYLEPA
jgi:nitrile hydratase beta subunit